MKKKIAKYFHKQICKLLTKKEMHVQGKQEAKLKSKKEK